MNAISYKTCISQIKRDNKWIKSTLSSFYHFLFLIMRASPAFGRIMLWSETFFSWCTSAFGVHRFIASAVKAVLSHIHIWLCCLSCCCCRPSSPTWQRQWQELHIFHSYGHFKCKMRFMLTSWAKSGCWNEVSICRCRVHSDGWRKDENYYISKMHKNAVWCCNWIEQRLLIYLISILRDSFSFYSTVIQ